MRGWAGECPGEPRPRRTATGGRVASPVASVCELFGQRLIEDEVRDGLGLGGVELGCLIEEKVSLRWPAGG